MTDQDSTRPDAAAADDAAALSQGHSGEAADLASRAVDETDLDALDVEERQDVLVDEAIEETFPASDPISPKRIT